MLATTRILVSKLATARVFCYPPTTLTLSLRPHCHLGIYRCQRSPTTRAAASPQRLRQWKHEHRLNDGIYGLGFLISLYSQYFIFSYWFLSQCICSALKNWHVNSTLVPIPSGRREECLGTTVCCVGFSTSPYELRNSTMSIREG